MCAKFRGLTRKNGVRNPRGVKGNGRSGYVREEPAVKRARPPSSPYRSSVFVGVVNHLHEYTVLFCSSNKFQQEFYLSHAKGGPKTAPYQRAGATAVKVCCGSERGRISSAVSGGCWCSSSNKQTACQRHFLFVPLKTMTQHESIEYLCIAPEQRCACYAYSTAQRFTVLVHAPPLTAHTPLAAVDR